MFRSSVLATVTLGLIKPGLAEFWIGGYSGELESGPVGNPSTDKVTGTWISTTLDCGKVGTGSPFPDDVDKKGQALYNWCNINFQVGGQFSDHNVYMGGDGARCGKACDSKDACPEGSQFAQLFDADAGGVQVATCVWDYSWSVDCASDGREIED
ncbi:hypothetical protein FDECE_18028 [Fusarium decemcellulare]|nr:hypothetical protein FDECE_18028 [Fusarium decemcellulare]